MGILLAAAGCGAPTAVQEDSMMKLTSSAFEDGGTIPTRHTCDGDDVSPPLAWSEAPDGTASFVLVVDDPDARDFIHWLLTDIPGDVAELPEGSGDAIGSPGSNDFGGTGWGGPCPPSGVHRYEFTLYALSQPVRVSGASDAEAVRQAVSGHVLAEAQLSASYKHGN